MKKIILGVMLVGVEVRSVFAFFILIMVFGTTMLHAVVISAATKKDKAYHTCRYEVKKLLDTLEEFDDVHAKVTYAKLAKQNNIYFVSCRFSNLIGRRGMLRFPLKKVEFKYNKRAYDFILDDRKNWVTYIGILHRG